MPEPTEDISFAKQTLAHLRASLSVPDLTEVNDNYNWSLIRSHFFDSRVNILWTASRLHDGRYAVDLLEINTIMPCRGRGFARRALHDFLAACDQAGVTLNTQVWPTQPDMSERMKAWFTRRGFVLDEDACGYRTPQLPGKHLA